LIQSLIEWPITETGKLDDARYRSRRKQKKVSRHEDREEVFLLDLPSPPVSLPVWGGAFRLKKWKEEKKNCMGLSNTAWAGMQLIAAREDRTKEN